MTQTRETIIPPSHHDLSTIDFGDDESNYLWELRETPLELLSKMFFKDKQDILCTLIFPKLCLDDTRDHERKIVWCDLCRYLWKIHRTNNPDKVFDESLMDRDDRIE